MTIEYGHPLNTPAAQSLFANLKYMVGEEDALFIWEIYSHNFPNPVEMNARLAVKLAEMKYKLPPIDLP